MKLNPDSVRAVLLYLEENLVLGKHLTTHDVVKGIMSTESIDEGTEDELAYALVQLQKNGMLDAKSIAPKSSFKHVLFIYDINPSGHEFLKNIKNNSIWEKTKKIALSKGGSFALNLLSQLANTIAMQELGIK